MKQNIGDIKMAKEYMYVKLTENWGGFREGDVVRFGWSKGQRRIDNKQGVKVPKQRAVNDPAPEPQVKKTPKVETATVAPKAETAEVNPKISPKPEAVPDKPEPQKQPEKSRRGRPRKAGD